MSSDMSFKKIQSSDCNVTKYVYDFGSAVAEAVAYRYPTFNERTVICCSTQSGCPVGCRFCGTGESFVRNLTGGEIVAQVQTIFTDNKIVTADVEKLQIMFMSMGEPMLNRVGMIEAIADLHILYPKAQLLVSTSGPRVSFDWLMSLSMIIENIGLQFSVHESTDEARNALIPFVEKMTLQEIADTGSAWSLLTGRKVFFNYCVHEKNGTDEDVARLRALFDPKLWNATLSVICERDESVRGANERQRSLTTAFQQKMNAVGYNTRMFDPAGQDDIGGGCGQLWFVQSWMKEHENLVRKSVGSGLKIVHAPKMINV